MTNYGKAPISLEEMNKFMSKEYHDMWNDEVQSEVDKNIEKHRKADASFEIPDLPVDTEIKVEQISHEFIFGAHIFNFNQLGKKEYNDRYKELYGTFFNSATVAFYWKKHELEEGKPRFAGEFWDSEEYWNAVKEPKKEVHWRRPASDPIIEFCESKGIRIHGHPITWGNQRWHFPDWITAKLPEHLLEKYQINKNNLSFRNMTPLLAQLSPEEIENFIPEYVYDLNKTMSNRIIDLALKYKDRVDSWDIVNESAEDFRLNLMLEDKAVCKSRYGLMPGDYTYRSFKIAEAFFPDSVQLNINDYLMEDEYYQQIDNLKSRNCKIDIVGSQIHMFNPQICLDVAEGKDLRVSPTRVNEVMTMLTKTNRPIHISEITITSPGADKKGESIQAVIARNLYRMWFSTKNMMGITWWNVVDDCGAPGEPAVSGLFNRDMTPKLAYFALNDLIHTEWKTNKKLRTKNANKVEFRGFRGDYRLSWTDKFGKKQSIIKNLK